MVRSTMRDAVRRFRVALIAARQALGLSQAEAAQLIGRDQSALCRMEAIHGEPPSAVLALLACAEHGQYGPIETLCREAGGYFVAGRVVVPAGMESATWSQLYARTMGAVAHLFDCYARASADGSLSRGEHTDLAAAWSRLHELDQYGLDIHTTAATGDGGESVDSAVRFVAPARPTG